MIFINSPSNSGDIFGGFYRVFYVNVSVNWI